MNEFNELMERDRKTIDEFKLNIAKGTKKVIKDFHDNAVKNKNLLIDKKLEQYNTILGNIKSILDSRKERLMPQKGTLDYNTLRREIDEKKKKLILVNKFSKPIDKLGLNYIFSRFSNVEDNNLEEINSLIKMFIDIFNAANINLKLDDFNYSLYTRIYMKSYLENINTDNFYEIMKETFEKIYWLCPNLIMHIKLCLKEIYNRNEKILISHISSFKIDKDTYNNYCASINNLNAAINMDAYGLCEDFLTGKKAPLDYVLNSAVRLKNFDKFLIGKKCDELSKEELEKFYSDIEDLNYLVEELKSYNYFKVFIDDAVKRYKNKDSYKNVTKSKLKEINKIDSERKKYMNNILPHKTLFKYVDNTKNEELIFKMSESIKRIIAEDKVYEEDINNDRIVDALSDTSTYLDIIRLIAANYSYFSLLIPLIKEEIDEDKLYDKLLDYAYNPHNTFSADTNMLSTDDIIETISNKYKLLNINVTKDDLNDLESLTNNINYILTVRNIEKLNIKFDDLEIINSITALDKKK